MRAGIAAICSTTVEGHGDFVGWPATEVSPTLELLAARQLGHRRLLRREARDLVVGAQSAATETKTPMRNSGQAEVSPMYATIHPPQP